MWAWKDWSQPFRSLCASEKSAASFMLECSVANSKSSNWSKAHENQQASSYYLGWSLNFPVCDKVLCLALYNSWSDFLCFGDLFIKGFAKFELVSILTFAGREINVHSPQGINHFLNLNRFSHVCMHSLFLLPFTFFFFKFLNELLHSFFVGWTLLCRRAKVNVNK